MKDYRPTPCKTAEQVNERLEFDGYAVIPIKSLDPDQLIATFRKDLVKLNPECNTKCKLMELDTTTDYPYTGPLNGLYGLCQSDFCWNVRCNSEIRDIFANILGISIKDLVCSMDAFSFTESTHPVNPKMWLHRDYNTHLDTPYDSYQGIYYLTETTKDGATTAVIPGSHTWEMKEEELRAGNHFVIHSDQTNDDRVHRLLMKPGELLIFNSKLLHQGCIGPNRLCVMVSYGNRADRTEEARQKKIIQYITGQRTTHWSQLGQAHGPKYHGWRDNKLTYPVKLNMEVLEDASETYRDDILEITKANYLDISHFDLYAEDLDQIIPTERLSLL